MVELIKINCIYYSYFSTPSPFIHLPRENPLCRDIKHYLYFLHLRYFDRVWPIDDFFYYPINLWKAKRMVDIHFCKRRRSWKSIMYEFFFFKQKRMFLKLKVLGRQFVEIFRIVLTRNLLSHLQKTSKNVSELQKKCFKLH